MNTFRISKERIERHSDRLTKQEQDSFFFYEIIFSGERSYKNLHLSNSFINPLFENAQDVLKEIYLRTCVKTNSPKILIQILFENINSSLVLQKNPQIQPLQRPRQGMTQILKIQTLNWILEPGIRRYSFTSRETMISIWTPLCLSPEWIPLGNPCWSKKWFLLTRQVTPS